MTFDELKEKYKEACLRHRRRLLAQERKAAGMEYRSIIEPDLIDVVLRKTK